MMEIIRTVEKADDAETKRLMARIKDLERDLSMWVSYADSYGNCTGTCRGGFPQHSGLICQACGSDRSAGDPCEIEKTQFARNNS